MSNNPDPPSTSSPSSTPGSSPSPTTPPQPISTPIQPRPPVDDIGGNALKSIIPIINPDKI